MCRYSVKYLHIFVGCVTFCLEFIFSKCELETLNDAKEMQMSLTSIFGLSLDGKKYATLAFTSSQKRIVILRWNTTLYNSSVLHVMCMVQITAV